MISQAVYEPPSALLMHLPLPCNVWYIPEASLCGGDLHRIEMEQSVEAGHSRIGPFEPLWADLCFLH